MKSTMVAINSRITPRYNGRDVAVSARASSEMPVLVLGLATPSLETRYNVERGKYTLLQLPERVENRPMPEVELIDMRTEFLETRKQSTFSRRLLTAIGEKLEAGEQVMLLHNRRGFRPSPLAGPAASVCSALTAHSL